MSVAESTVDVGQLAMQANGEIFHHVEGRAVPFDVYGDVGLFLERHAQGSFTESLSRKWRLPLLWAHDNRAMPIGISDTWESRADGLWGRWEIAPSAIGQEAARWARDGALGLSIGFQPVRSSWQYSGDWDPQRGADHMDRVTRLESRLLEVSLVATPAFEGAVVDWVEADSLDGTARSLAAGMRSWIDRHRYEPSRPALGAT
jgi:HK97 family phage prohead protease